MGGKKGERERTRKWGGEGEQEVDTPPTGERAKRSSRRVVERGVGRGEGNKTHREHTQGGWGTCLAFP